MLRLKALPAILLGAAAIAAGAQTRPAGGTPLTASDYIQIRELVARYAYAVDSGADNGNVYADLFAPSGAFLDRTGRATTGRRRPRGLLQAGAVRRPGGEGADRGAAATQARHAERRPAGEAARRL